MSKRDLSTEMRSSAVSEEDGRTHTPKALASLKRALADVKAGRVFQLTEEELLRGKYPKRAARKSAAHRANP